MIIYKIINLVNGKIYVGQTSNLGRRIAKHLKGTTGPFISAAIKKYGKENFRVEVIEDGLTDDQVNEREQHWIAICRSHERESGYNLTLGGHGTRGNKETREKLSSSLKGMWAGERNPNFGKKHTQEARNRISAAQRGRKQSLDHIEKRARALRGRVYTAEHRAKISAAKMGQIVSEATREKIRAHHLGRPSPLRGRPKTAEHIARVVEAKKRNRLARLGAAS